jgi:hypothetical protein
MNFRDDFHKSVNCNALNICFLFTYVSSRALLHGCCVLVDEDEEVSCVLVEPSVFLTTGNSYTKQRSRSLAVVVSEQEDVEEDLPLRGRVVASPRPTMSLGFHTGDPTTTESQPVSVLCIYTSVYLFMDNFEYYSSPFYKTTYSDINQTDRQHIFWCVWNVWKPIDIDTKLFADDVNQICKQKDGDKPCAVVYHAKTITIPRLQIIKAYCPVIISVNLWGTLGV